MSDYIEYKIYAVKSKQTDKVYIGFTSLMLCEAFYHLKKNCSYKQYGRILGEILVYNDAYIELIEKILCKNKGELIKRQKELMNKTKNCVNNPSKEFNKRNYDKNYYKKNRDRLTEVNDCECGGKYTVKNKCTHLRTQLHQEYIK